jgi:hypothetical protein
MLILVAKTDCCETHARFVLLWPTSRAFFARRVNRFFPRFAKTQLGKALTCVVTCLIQAFARPARITFASGIFAFGTQCRARTSCRQLCWRLTEADCSETIARLVFSRPTGRTFLSC